MTTLNVGFVTETCCHKDCNITFAFTTEFYNRVKNDGSWWYCPLGHGQHYTGKTDAQRLRDAEARETALRDQLEASIRDGEAARSDAARVRQRIANGVCPCCSRSFENVRRHMATQHPEFAAETPTEKRIRFECGCGSKFDTYRGLRIHQGKWRRDDWARPGKDRWSSHLTVAATS